MHNIKTHKYSLGQILSHAWKLYTGNFWLLITLVLIVYIPVDILAFVAPEIVVNVITFLVTPIPVMAIAYAVSRLIKGEKTTFQKAFNESVSRLFWALGTAILEAILLFGLFLLLIVPGIIYSIYWFFAMYPVILHDKYGRHALAYSKSVVKGRWWKVLGYTFVLALSLILLILAIGAPFVFLYPATESQIFFTNYALSDLLINAIAYAVSVFFEVAFVIFFINLDYTKTERNPI